MRVSAAVAWPARVRLIVVESRGCFETATSSESKAVRLSAASRNDIVPVCGRAQPSVPEPPARAPFHSV